MLSGFSESLRNLQYRLKKPRSLLDMKCVEYDTNFIEFSEWKISCLCMRKNANYHD